MKQMETNQGLEEAGEKAGRHGGPWWLYPLPSLLVLVEFFLNLRWIGVFRFGNLLLGHLPAIACIVREVRAATPAERRSARRATKAALTGFGILCVLAFGCFCVVFYSWGGC